MQIEFVIILKILIFSSEYSIGATKWFRLIYHMILIYFFLSFFWLGRGGGVLELSYTLFIVFQLLIPPCFEDIVTVLLM